MRYAPTALLGIACAMTPASMGGSLWSVNSFETTWSYQAATTQFGTFIDDGGTITDQSFFETFDEFEGLPGTNSGAVEPLVQIGHAASFGNPGGGDLRGLAEVQVSNARTFSGDTLNASSSVSGSLAFTLHSDVEFGYTLLTDRTMSASDQTVNSFASLRLDRVDGGVVNIFDLSTDERIFGSTMLSAGDYLITADAFVEVSRALSSTGLSFTAQRGYNAFFQIIPTPSTTVAFMLPAIGLMRRRR